MANKLLKLYAKAGAKTPQQIIALASTRGSVALAEAKAALAEAGRLHNTAMLIIPAEPPGKNLCNFIRKLIPNFSKIVIIAQQSSGRLAPGNFDKLIRASMPDAERKIKVMDSSASVGEAIEQAAANGLYVKSHALQIFCDQQLARNFAQEIKDGRFRLDPTTITVASQQIPKDDTEAIVKSLNTQDLAAMHRVLDPHVFSSETGIPDYKMALLRKENKLFESNVDDSWDDVNTSGEDDSYFSTSQSPPSGKFSDTNAFQDLLEKYADKLHAKGIQVTGEELGTGTMGTAFMLTNGKVLKMTYDESEAKASALIMQHPAEHLVKIFDVFKFPTSVGNKFVFGVVKEKLEELSRSEKQSVIRDPKSVEIPAMKIELKKAGVTNFNDFNPGNIMKRGSTYVLVDPGYSKTIDGNTPTLEAYIPMLNEFGVQAGPSAGAGPQMRGMGTSAWSMGKNVLKLPKNHVPEDENATEKDRALDQDIRGGGLDWGRRNRSSV